MVGVRNSVVNPINPRFERIRPLGEGSFGKIWLVRHRDSGEKLVLKEITVKTEEERKEAANEADVLAKVSHVNLIGFIELVQPSPQLVCILQEYADDGDVQQKVQVRKGRSEHFPQQVVLRWVAQLTQALDHLHSQGIIHRDVKTANLFLTKTGHLKLGDFGVAKVLDTSPSGAGPPKHAAERTTATPGVGTPMYMAPEVCDDNNPYTTRSDCWGIGCVLYELCALRPAFTARSMEKLIAKVKRGQYGRKLPPLLYTTELTNLISSLFAVDPAIRPSTAHVLALPVLEAVLKGTPATLLRQGKEPRPYSPVVSVEERRRSLASQSWAPEIMKINHHRLVGSGSGGFGFGGGGGGGSGRRGSTGEGSGRHHDDDVDVSATARANPSPIRPISAGPGDGGSGGDPAAAALPTGLDAGAGKDLGRGSAGRASFDFAGEASKIFNDLIAGMGIDSDDDDDDDDDDAVNSFDPETAAAIAAAAAATEQGSMLLTDDSSAGADADVDADADADAVADAASLLLSAPSTSTTESVSTSEEQQQQEEPPQQHHNAGKIAPTAPASSSRSPSPPLAAAPLLTAIPPIRHSPAPPAPAPLASTPPAPAPLAPAPLAPAPLASAPLPKTRSPLNEPVATSMRGAASPNVRLKLGPIESDGGGGAVGDGASASAALPTLRVSTPAVGLPGGRMRVDPDALRSRSLAPLGVVAASARADGGAGPAVEGDMLRSRSLFPSSLPRTEPEGRRIPGKRLSPSLSSGTSPSSSYEPEHGLGGVGNDGGSVAAEGKQKRSSQTFTTSMLELSEWHQKQNVVDGARLSGGGGGGSGGSGNNSSSSSPSPGGGTGGFAPLHLSASFGTPSSTPWHQSTKGSSKAIIEEARDSPRGSPWSSPSTQRASGGGKGTFKKKHARSGSYGNPLPKLPEPSIEPSPAKAPE